MFSTQLAQTAYAATAPVQTPRGMEFKIFQSVTDALKRTVPPNASIAARAEALQRNRRLWTVLAIDVAEEENRLPVDTRAQVLSLAEFTLRNTGAALRDPSALTTLIDINAAMMRGLAGDGGNR